LIAAKHCQRVCAFEPEPRTRTHLEEHVLRNGLANVTVMPYALSSVDGFASLQLGPETNSGMNRLNPGSVAGRGAVEVQTARADSLVRANWIPGPDVMKIDVEGAEGLVLEGATEVLLAPKLRAVIFETPDNGHGMPSDQRLVELLGSSFRITPLGPSDPEVKNSMNNFVAVRTQS
jgi:FkbM family methyltransferase